MEKTETPTGRAPGGEEGTHDARGAGWSAKRRSATARASGMRAFETGARGWGAPGGGDCLVAAAGPNRERKPPGFAFSRGEGGEKRAVYHKVLYYFELQLYFIRNGRRSTRAYAPVTLAASESAAK